MVVYYGQARDWFGWPYVEDASVILLSGTNEIARYDIKGSISPGVNFALYVPLDDGRDTNRYVRSALRTGEVVSIVVEDPYDGRMTIMESNAVPAVTTPGDMILVNVTAGSDADGDQLPDQWEEILVYWSDGVLSSIWDVNPNDDFDGDGQSNMDEFLAGTFAFLDCDYFFIEKLDRVTDQLLRISFLSVPGKVYRLWGASLTLHEGKFDWQLEPYSRTLNGPLGEGPVEGTGFWLDFYVPLPENCRVFKLTVQ
mgnify:CR=1 FL=1